MAKSEYPYVTVTTSLRKFIEDLPTYGRPTKVTQKWLEGLGFKSTNDRRLIPVLKFVGFVSSEGVPTPVWARYRGAERGAVLAEALRQSYGALFQTFPDAQRRDAEALLNFFRANTDLAEGAARRCVQTFQILAAAADWDKDPPDDIDLDEDDDVKDENDEQRLGKDGRSSGRRRKTPPTGGITLNINIQLQLPANADGKTYDQLFAAMGKHLKDLGGIG
jgi:hypothetical protein